MFAFSEHFESYRANSNAGNLYLQDVGGRYFVLRPGQKVWGRQVNPETNVPIKIRNNGATLWILGLKTEGNGVVIDTYNNGKTEVLGAMLYPLTSQGLTPAFTNVNSSVSLTFATYDYHTPPQNYDVLVRETRGTETRDYRGLSNRARISLFVGYPGATSSALTAASAPSS